jgi:hypothetical protein
VGLSTRNGVKLLVVAGLVSPSLAGCASPNTYATARTVPQGDFQHTVAVEGIGFHSSQGTGALPILPTYQLRVGVLSRMDVGARIGSLTEAGADVKVNFLRGPLDLAIAGGAEAFLEWHYDPHPTDPGHKRRTGARAFLHVPLIASYNFSKELSLVGTPGIAYVIGRKVNADSVRTQAMDGGTLAVRLGIGIDYRYKKGRAIHPEITWLQSTEKAQTIVLFGVGFNFGDAPSYDDIGGPEPSLDRVEPKPPEPTKPAEPQKPAEPAPPPPEPTPPPPSPPQPTQKPPEGQPIF